MKRKFSLVELIVLIIICVFSYAEEKPILSFDAERYSVAITKSITLKAAAPKGKMKLDWSSSNEEVATVSPAGAVKGLSVGETVITVKSVDNPEISASCWVSVVNPVKRIFLSEKTFSLATGTTWTLIATVEPEDATNKSLVWTSSNEKVAMVSENGVITALSRGSAKITAAATDGSNVKMSANVKVDDYQIVFTTPFAQQASYKYTFQGTISIRGRVKKGNVRIWDVDRDMFGGVFGGYADGQFSIAPIKAGTDVVTLTTGGSRVNFSVFVHPDTFKLQELGFGKGAVVSPGELGVFNGHTYKIVKDKCTWNEAFEKCKKAGGHLLTVTSSGEQQFIELLNYDNHLLWFGLRKGNAGVWKWVTNEDMGYTNWDNGEPNDYATREYPYENVGAIRPKWNDYHENNKKDIYGYVCEWDSVTVDVDSVEEEGQILEPEWLGILNDHTYQIINEKCTWNEAKKKCEELGGHLVTITSPSEQRFLSQLNKSNKTLWIGLRKGVNADWFWVTGEDLIITCWEEGEPNNYFTRDYPDENVVAMRPYWCDYHENNISDFSGFICEWDSVVINPKDYSDEEGIITKPNSLGEYKNHRYKIFDDKCTWTQAKEKCELEGGYLATIGSPGEQRFIEKLNRSNKTLWIGLHRGEDEKFHWVTEEPVEYIHWAGGQPDNYQSTNFQGEDSVAIWPEWNDYNDNDIGPIDGFVCEWNEDSDIPESIKKEMENATNQVDVVDRSLIPDSAAEYNGHSYKVFEQSMSWSAARDKCEETGGHLVTIASQAEQRFLEEMIQGKGEFWIGLHRGNDDAFYWITDEQVGYTNWGTGEPNNYQSFRFSGEDSVAMRPDWNDYNDNDHGNIAGYICEWDDTRIEENKNQTDDKKVAKDTSGDINEQVVSVPTSQLYQTMVDDSGIFKKTEKMSQDEIASKGESIIEWKSFNISVIATLENKVENNEKWEYLRVGCFIDGEPEWGYITGMKKNGQEDTLKAFIGGTKDDPCVYIYNERTGLNRIDMIDGSADWTLSRDQVYLGDLAAYVSGEDTGILYAAGSYGPDPVAISNEGNILWHSDIGLEGETIQYMELTDNCIEVRYESGSMEHLEYNGKVMP